MYIGMEIDVKLNMAAYISITSSQITWPKTKNSRNSCDSDVNICSLMNAFKDPLKQMFSSVTANEQTQDVIVQYYVKTPPRYDQNCSVWCQN